MSVIIFGDSGGIMQLIRHVPNERILGLVCASIRPQYIPDLEKVSKMIGVPLLIQPKWSTKDYNDFVVKLRDLRPEVLWINSYSMILRPDVLAIPTKGVINIHGALLPKNRGCNPIQWAIIRREMETGVTLHEVDEGLDTGPIIDQIKVPLPLKHTWMDVRRSFESATDRLIEVNLSQILAGKWQSAQQNELEATQGRRRNADDGHFSWQDPIIDIFNKIRALLPPIPPAYYINASGDKVYMTEMLPLWKLLSIKAAQFSNELFKGQTILLLPTSSLTIGDLNLRFLLFSDQKKVLLDVDSSGTHHLCFEIKMTTTNEIIGVGFLTNINWSEGEAELVLTSAQEHNLSDFSPWLEATKLISEIGFGEFLFKRICIQIGESNEHLIPILESLSLNIFLHSRAETKHDFSS